MYAMIPSKYLYVLLLLLKTEQRKCIRSICKNFYETNIEKISRSIERVEKKGLC